MKKARQPISKNLSNPKAENYRIVISSKAQKDFNRLDNSVKKRITSAILKLETVRFPAQFKSLIGKDIASFRLRVGDFRVLYDVYDSEKTVLILRIGHRREIYK